MNASGRHKRNLRIRMHKAQGGACKYCGQRIPLGVATFDHVIPKCLGGTGRQTNLVIACVNCNRKKANKPPHVWMNELAQGLVA